MESNHYDRFQTLIYSSLQAIIVIMAYTKRCVIGFKQENGSSYSGLPPLFGTSVHFDVT